MLSWVRRLLCLFESGGEGCGVQSASGGRTTPVDASTPAPPGKSGSFKKPLTTCTPPTTGHTYGAPKAKTLDMPSKPKLMFSPKWEVPNGVMVVALGVS